MGELSKLPNIGEDTERQLNQIGINTVDELKSMGAKQAWIRIQEFDDSACFHRLLGLEGAVQGVRKILLSEECKADLKEFYKWSKK